MFKGSCVALVTPMHEDGRIDFSALEALVNWHIQEGTAAIVACGTTGESVTLSHDEQQKVIQKTLEVAKGRIPVIAGTGTNATQKVIELCREAKSLGVSGCLIVTPYYNKPTQEGLYRHYAAIAEAVDIPIILYNVPGRTAVDLLPDTVVKLSKIENIVGIKEATGDIDRLRELRERCRKDFLFYSGDDATSLEFMLEGGHGVISVTSNVVPGIMQKMCEAAIAGQAAKAKSMNETLALVHKRLMIESNPIPVKWALNAMGRIAKGIRLPLTPLSEIHIPSVREALIQAGVLNA
ncbi:MAG: 4-hydroxy-tetrahydrodipicolinate synthase [Gammaproteobacteria bacterium]